MAGGSVPANLAPIFQQAGAQYNIPPEVLAGISSVESNIFQNTGPSSAGAIGGMQFEPRTAKALGVNPNDPRSAIFGAAKLLTQYGYHQNPMRAIGAYNGGPGNPQMGYANQVMSEAARLKGQVAGGGAPAAQSAQPSTPAQVTVDPSKAILAGYLKSTPSGLWDTTKGGKDFGSSSPALMSYLTAAQSNLQALAGQTPLVAHPAVQQQTSKNLGSSSIAGGFLPQGAKYVQGRKDQGRDGQTTPGGPLIAPGAGYVVRVGSDPGGFGPKYLIAHFTTGPYAGRTMYLGHTLAAVTQGSFKQGQVLATTGTSPVGNASVPGWFEVGFADSGSPGPMSQPAPF